MNFLKFIYIHYPMNNYERPFFLPKEALDTVNSVSWFLLDASWMLNIRELTYVMIIPTILSALILCYIEKRSNILLINLAILSWILMNISWMFSELYNLPSFFSAAKILFFSGLILILAAIFTSKNITETFSHFKRFRLKTKK
jgi:hypothetical protein